jgi:hypothetical protein
VSLSHQAQQATQGRAANQDTQTRSTRQELKNRSGWDSVHDELLTEVSLRLLMIELFFLEVSFLKFNFDLAIEEHCPRRSNHLAHSARADLCRRSGRIPEARASHEKALALARQEPERRFLARRLEELKYKREPGNVPFVLSSQFPVLSLSPVLSE